MVTKIALEKKKWKESRKTEGDVNTLCFKIKKTA